MNDNYFNDYLEAKSCLYHMIGQFFDYYLPIKTADKYKIDYTEEDKDIGKTIKVIFHDFKEEGLLAWELLDIKEPILKYNELWELEKKLKEEQENKNINYCEKYLKMCILLIDMTTNYYIKKYELNCAQNYEIEYDEELDIYDDVMFVCHHEFESAGEAVWRLFDIEHDIVGESIFLEKRKKFVICALGMMLIIKMLKH